jgi:hypothetical protein
LGSASPAEKTGGKHFAVVENYQIIWAEKIRKVTKAAILDFACGTVKVQKSRTCSLR